MIKSGLKVSWVVIFLLVIGYFLYQSNFIEHYEDKKEFINPLKEKETIFLSITDHNFSLRKKGFDQLTDSLKFWEYDTKNDTIYLKEQTLLPSEFTPLVVVYDRGNDSFEKQENVLPISTFPYSIYQNDFGIEISHFDKNGKLYFSLLDKKLSLEPGKSYQTIFFQGFKLRSIKIKNFGVKHIDNFKLFPEIEKELKEQEKKKIEQEKLEKKAEKKTVENKDNEDKKENLDENDTESKKEDEV